MSEEERPFGQCRNDELKGMLADLLKAPTPAAHRVMSSLKGRRLELIDHLKKEILHRAVERVEEEFR